MGINPFILANKQGIPRIESTAVNVSATAVTFSFRRHPFLSMPFNGLMIVNMAQAVPDGTTTTLPVQFDTNGVQRTLSTFDGADVTVADIPGTGVYLAYYDSQSGRLSLLTGIV